MVVAPEGLGAPWVAPVRSRIVGVGPVVARVENQTHIGLMDSPSAHAILEDEVVHQHPNEFQADLIAAFI